MLAYGISSHLEKTRSTTAAVWLLSWICCYLFTERLFFSLPMINGLMEPHTFPINLRHWLVNYWTGKLHSLEKDSKQSNYSIHINTFILINTHKLPIKESLLFHTSISSHVINYCFLAAWNNFGTRMTALQVSLLLSPPSFFVSPFPSFCHKLRLGQNNCSIPPPPSPC